ncbi:pyridoxal-phosphate dependent enzyme [Streptomyces sp. NPDC048604]|uniref:pyridoxal-phosphate dependent enzyme n=1 Tax=Streptomyces sp. NPDC048604 TaxID=3365578 RepID=UPI00371E4352
MLAVMTAYVCPRCGSRAAADTLTWCCPQCRGPWDLAFTAAPVPLPSLASRVNSLWRYAEALPLATSLPRVTLGEGRTPVVPLSETVSAKLDFLTPTLSFKDRGAVMLAELARRLRPRLVVADSSGNAGTAVAAYTARAGLPCAVYVPEGTSAKKLEQIRAHGARLAVVPGGRDAAARAAQEAAGEPGAFYASHVFNPHFLHGTKTYVYELWEDGGGTLPDTLVVPVGNGTLLLGTALALDELHGHGLISKRPALLAVQAEAVSPLAAAYRAGATDLTGPARPAAPTLAEGIAIPHPPRAAQILRAVRDNGGTFLTVTDAQIRDAQADLARRGLYVETTAAACWAAVRAEPPRPGSTVLPLCGAGAKTGLAAPPADGEG